MRCLSHALRHALPNISGGSYISIYHLLRVILSLCSKVMNFISYLNLIMITHII